MKASVNCLQKRVTEEDVNQERTVRELFRKTAGEDLELDPYELKNLLNSVYGKGGSCTVGSFWFKHSRSVSVKGEKIFEVILIFAALFTVTEFQDTNVNF